MLYTYSIRQEAENCYNKNAEKDYSMKTQLMKKEILGVGVTDATEENILEYVVDFIENEKGQLFITTPNPEILVYATHHQRFADILTSAHISLPDGVGVVVAGAILGKTLKSRITGVDFMKNLCEKVSTRPITVGFLGGKGDVALKASECLKSTFPTLQILLAEAGNPDDFTAKNIQKRFAKDQRPVTIDILFVGFGFPKQEEWIHAHLQELPVRVAMTVGGSFDIVSGSLPRAPRLMRNVGLEWLWRLFLQPSRWKRQIKLVEFVWLVLKEKFKIASN